MLHHINYYNYLIGLPDYVGFYTPIAIVHVGCGYIMHWE